jgi:hypothetical protein
VEGWLRLPTNCLVEIIPCFVGDPSLSSMKLCRLTEVFILGNFRGEVDSFGEAVLIVGMLEEICSL